MTTIKELTFNYLLEVYKHTKEYPSKLVLPRNLYLRLVFEIMPESPLYGAQSTWMTPIGPIELVQG